MVLLTVDDQWWQRQGKVFGWCCHDAKGKVSLGNLRLRLSLTGTGKSGDGQGSQLALTKPVCSSWLIVLAMFIPHIRDCARSNAPVYSLFPFTSRKWKSCKKTFLSVVNIHPAALQDIQSSLQSRSGWWSLFLHITETEVRKISHEDSEVNDLSRAEPLLLISPLQIPCSFWVQRKGCCYRNQWGKCTLYHVLYTFSRRSFNLSLPPCNFTETIMLIKPLNITVTSNQIN